MKKDFVNFNDFIVATIQQHWLYTYEQYVLFKVACIIYKVITTGQPSYLRTLLQYYTANRALRSVAQCLLEQLRFSTEFGRRSFSYFALSYSFTYLLNYSFKCHLLLLLYILRSLGLCTTHDILYCTIRFVRTAVARWHCPFLRAIRGLPVTVKLPTLCRRTTPHG